MHESVNITRWRYPRQQESPQAVTFLTEEFTFLSMRHRRMMDGINGLHAVLEWLPSRKAANESMKCRRYPQTWLAFASESYSLRTTVGISRRFPPVLHRGEIQIHLITKSLTSIRIRLVPVEAKSSALIPWTWSLSKSPAEINRFINAIRKSNCVQVAGEPLSSFLMHNEERTLPYSTL